MLEYIAWKYTDCFGGAAYRSSFLKNRGRWHKLDVSDFTISQVAMKVYRHSESSDFQLYYGLRFYDKYTNRTVQVDFSEEGDDKRARKA